MKNEKNQPRSRRSLKVQDLETTGVEVKGGSDTPQAAAYEHADCVSIPHHNAGNFGREGQEG